MGKDRERQQLLSFINQRHPGVGDDVLIPTKNRRCRSFQKAGIRALAYHRGLSAEERYENQHIFQQEEGR